MSVLSHDEVTAALAALPGPVVLAGYCMGGAARVASPWEFDRTSLRSGKLCRVDALRQRDRGRRE